MGREQPLPQAQSRFSSPRPEHVGVFGNAEEGQPSLARLSRSETGATPCRNAGG